VLEIGPGEGAMAVRLAQRYDYVGVELDPHSFAKAQARLAVLGRGRVIQGELSALEPSERFDLICAFEVLEHIEDDAGALREWSERLRPGGWLLLSVPAFARRWGATDRKAGHYRRYEPDGLVRLFTDTGLVEPRVSTYGFPLGYALEAGRNFLARREQLAGSIEERTAASGRWLQPSDSLGWLTRWGTVPFRLLQRPLAHRGVGTGLVGIARIPAH
jgi:SAM-dependent methyltransferase